MFDPVSDHLPVTFTIKQRSPIDEKTRCTLIRNLQPANLHEFREQISVTSWDKMCEDTLATHSKTKSRAHDNFLGIISPTFESACPLKLIGKEE